MTVAIAVTGSNAMIAATVGTGVTVAIAEIAETGETAGIADNEVIAATAAIATIADAIMTAIAAPVDMTAIVTMPATTGTAIIVVTTAIVTIGTGVDGSSGRLAITPIATPTGMPIAITRRATMHRVS